MEWIHDWNDIVLFTFHCRKSGTDSDEGDKEEKEELAH